MVYDKVKKVLANLVLLQLIQRVEKGIIHLKMSKRKGSKRRDSS